MVELTQVDKNYIREKTRELSEGSIFSSGEIRDYCISMAMNDVDFISVLRSIPPIINLATCNNMGLSEAGQNISALLKTPRTVYFNFNRKLSFWERIKVLFGLKVCANVVQTFNNTVHIIEDRSYISVEGLKKKV